MIFRKSNYSDIILLFLCSIRLFHEIIHWCVYSLTCAGWVGDGPALVSSILMWYISFVDLQAGKNGKIYRYDSFTIVGGFSEFAPSIGFKAFLSHDTSVNWAGICCFSESLLAVLYFLVEHPFFLLFFSMPRYAVGFCRVIRSVFLCVGSGDAPFGCA